MAGRRDDDGAGNGAAVAALVLGIMGLLLGLVAPALDPVAVLAGPGLVCSLLALLLGGKGRRAANERDGAPGRAVASTGMILGSLGVVASIVNLAFGPLRGPMYLVVLLVVGVGLPIWTVVGSRRRRVREIEQRLVLRRPAEGWPLVYHDNPYKLLFRVTTDADRYGPGDTVTGTVAVAEPSRHLEPAELLTRARSVSVGLRYVDHSAGYRSPRVGHGGGGFVGMEGERSGRGADYRGGSDHVTVTVHQGETDPTVEYPFSLQLPERPRPGGSWGLLHLYWAVSVGVDRRLGGDVDEVHPITVVVPPGATEPRIAEPTKVGPRRGWGVSITSPTEVGRGDDLTVEVEVQDPAPTRTGLRVSLRCTGHYAEEGRKLVSRSQEGWGGGSRLEYKRKWADAIVHEKSVGVDGSSRNQLVSLKVPADGPFSHPGECAGLTWELVATEPKRRGGNHELRLPVTVLP